MDPALLPETLMAKLFDWNPGRKTSYQKYKLLPLIYRRKSICVVGLLGWMIGSNGINKHGIFVERLILEPVLTLKRQAFV